MPALDHSPRPSLLSTTHACARQTSGGEIHTRQDSGPSGETRKPPRDQPGCETQGPRQPRRRDSGCGPPRRGACLPAATLCSPLCQSLCCSVTSSLGHRWLWYRVRAARPFQRPPHQIKELCRGLSGTWWARVAVATGGSEDRLRTKRPGTTLETPLQLFKRRGCLCRMIVI